MAASSSLEGSVCIARCMEGMYIKISIAVDVGFKKKKKKQGIRNCRIIIAIASGIISYKSIATLFVVLEHF